MNNIKSILSNPNNHKYLFIIDYTYLNYPINSFYVHSFLDKKGTWEDSIEEISHTIDNSYYMGSYDNGVEDHLKAALKSRPFLYLHANSIEELYDTYPEYFI